MQKNQSRELMKIMADDVLESSGALTLKNLREHLEKNPPADPEALRLSRKLLGLAHLACLNTAEKNLTCAAEYFCETEDIPELQNALRLAKLYGNITALWQINLFGTGAGIAALQVEDFGKWLDNRRTSASPSRDDVDAKFRAFCEERGIKILRKMQDGIAEIRACSNVYLILDTDGTAKIAKEILEYNNGRLGNIFSREDRLYAELPKTDFLPRYYGTMEIDDGPIFIKESVHYGQPLSDYTTPEIHFSRAEVYEIILKIAEKIKWLHDRGIWHLDIKPENFFWNGKDILMMDLGIARKVAAETESVDIYLADPRYATPEGAAELRAYETSDVCQLGLIFHKLLTGGHPFALDSKSNKSREEEILKCVWPMMVSKDGDYETEYVLQPWEPILPKMLAKDPRQRATLPEVIEALKRNAFKAERIGPQKRPKTTKDDREWILFPARMGIPHKGHISYISRLIELGFRVLVSIQRSYTITNRDPIPKWLVMKMAAQSLLGRGFHENDFDFVLTPYYRTEQELLMHFAIMPKMEKIIAVASGNPGVHRIFSPQTILSQKAVFAFEDEPYENLSWGEIVRGAVRDNDRKLFDEYAAEGVEKIMPLAELRESFGGPKIEFVPGKVTASLKRGNETIAKTRIFRYSDPETSLASRLRMKNGQNVEVANRFASPAEWTIGGKPATVKYLSQEFDGENLTINFALL